MRFELLGPADMVLPPDMEANRGCEFWAPCMEREPFLVIECLT